MSKTIYIGEQAVDQSSTDEGLQKSGTTMSQIPTYVTAVPNGTEKVWQVRESWSARTDLYRDCIWLSTWVEQISESVP